MSIVRFSVVLSLCAGLGEPWTAAAQSASPTTHPAPPVTRTPDTDPNDPAVWNAERMMEDAVQTLTRRYNLNQEQEKYTRVLLTTRTRDFLKEHEHELRALIKENIMMRIGQMPSTPASYQAWSDRARPIFEAAKRAILDGNREWRDILNDPQRAIHDRDLSQMHESFAQIDRLMSRWSTGGFAPTDLVPQPPPEAGTVQPFETQVSRNPVSTMRRIEDVWLHYVQQVIKVYKFTAEQSNSAYAILQDARNRASNYRDSRKKELEGAEARLRDATRANADAGAIEQARSAAAALEQPITELFAELRSRLEGIASKTQRDQVSEPDRRNLNLLADAAAGGAAKRRAAGPTSKPAHPTRRATQREGSPVKTPAGKPQPTTAVAGPTASGKGE